MRSALEPRSDVKIACLWRRSSRCTAISVMTGDFKTSGSSLIWVSCSTSDFSSQRLNEIADVGETPQPDHLTARAIPGDAVASLS